MRPLATIPSPATGKKVIAHLGVRTEPLPPGARGPMCVFRRPFWRRTRPLQAAERSRVDLAGRRARGWRPRRRCAVLPARKSHYGSRSRCGTEVAARFYSLLETAKLSDEKPKAYLHRAVFAALAGETIPLPGNIAVPPRDAAPELA
jgi:hypothetical protein